MIFERKKQGDSVKKVHRRVKEKVVELDDRREARRSTSSFSGLSLGFPFTPYLNESCFIKNIK